MEEQDRDRAVDRVVDGGLVTVDQAAEFLSMSRSAVYLLMQRGDLARCKIGKSVRIPRASLVQLAGRSLVGLPPLSPRSEVL